MNDQLTFDELQAYQLGQLTGPDRHRVERLLLEDPFYADALAGLEAMQQTNIGMASGPMTEQMADLRSALHQRIHASASQKRLWPVWIATATAAILFMLAVAIYFIFFAPNRRPRPKPAAPSKTVFVSPQPRQNPAFENTMPNSFRLPNTLAIPFGH